MLFRSVQVIIEFIEPLVHSIEDENSLIRLEDEELANELVGAISESASELKERYCK